MPSEIGKLIDFDTDSGKSATERNHDGDKRDPESTIRPPEKSDSFFEYEPIEPAAIRIDGDAGDSGARRTKSGRIDRRTLRGRQKEVSQTVGIDGLSVKDLLIGIHAFGASITGIEELEIDEAEGKKLGDAVEELGKIYGHTINPKTAAWVNFAAAAGVVYGPRFVAYRERMKRESAEKPKTAAATNLRPTTNAAPDLEAAVRRHSASNAARAGNEIPNPSQFWNEPLEGW